MDLRISNRTVVRVFLLIAALAAGLYLLWIIRGTVVLVLLSGFLAIALGPPVEFFVRRRVPRPMAILLVYLCIAIAIFGVGLLLVPPIVNGVSKLSSDLPSYIDHLRHSATFRHYDNKYDITAKLNAQAAKLPQKLGTAVGTLQALTVGVFSAVVKLVTVMTLTFFLLLDGWRVVRWVLHARGTTAHSDRLERIFGDVYRATAGYVAGNLVISVCAGTVTWLTLAILGVPFAVPLAVLMAFLDLIPMVGATIGGIAIGLVTLVHGFPTSTIVWVVVLLVYQQVENNVLQPLVYRQTVDVHPFIVIVAILIGSTLLGVLGALIAIPVAAGLQIVVREIWEIRHEQAVSALTDPAPEI